jgi:hypothetical protein
MSLDFAIFTAVDDPSKAKTIRACTASELEAKDTTEITTGNQIHKLEVPIQVAWKPTSGEPFNITSMVNAVEKNAGILWSEPFDSAFPLCII